MTDLYPLAVIGVVSIVTFTLRAVPFLLFGHKPLPKSIQYLGTVLPPAIMTILVLYCIRSIDLSSRPYGLPEIISCIVVAALQIFRSNMYLSIISGTLCYMMLIKLI